MKTRLSALLLVLVTCACSGSSAAKSGATATPTPTSTPAASASPKAASPADIKLAQSLVRVTDLPTGYTRDAATRGTGLAVSTSDSACAQRFSALNLLRTAGPLKPTATARASFSKGAAGPFIRTTARRYSNSGAAAKVVKAVDQILRGCPSFTATNPRNKRLTTVSLTPLSFPHVGDQGVAAGGRLVNAGKGVDIDLVYVRTGASVAFVAEIAAGPADVPALERAVRAEVKRLSSAK